MSLTVADVDVVLAQEVIIAISGEHEEYPRQLSFQPSSRRYTVWSYDHDRKGMVTQHFDYVHMAVDCFNSKENTRG